MQINEKDTLVPWLKIGVPLLTGIGVLAATVLHFAFSLPLSETLGPVGVLLLIQVGIYVLMFWVRKRFGRTQDPRLAIAVFGTYCLVMGIAAIHYGDELKLIGVRKSEYPTFSAVVIVATIIMLAISPKWKVDK